MKKRKLVLIISYTCAFSIAFGALAAFYREQNVHYERYVRASYRHSFSELVTAMGEVDSALQKSVYAATPEMVSAVCTEIFGKAMTAQMSIGTLPFSTQELERTAAFVSNVGDYAYSLSRGASGGAYTEEELENLKALSETATLLSQNLKSLQDDLSAGNITMDELIAAERKLDEAGEQSGGATVGGSMRLIESEFPEIPSLIYDGPFSEHIKDMQPKMLEGANEISEEKAKQIASSFTGINKDKLNFSGQSEGGIMPSYYFTADTKSGELSITVTKTGGFVTGFLHSREAGEGTMTPEQASALAEKFLENRGYTDMAQTYYIIQNNVITINYAYKKDDVLCYSDLVKVAIALDNRSVCGFEARGYIANHYEREIPEAAISEEEARALVSAELKELSHQLCIIPSAGQNELFCHEFKCETEDGRHYIIYVNAMTGAQEKILILIEDETGALTL